MSDVLTHTEQTLHLAQGWAKEADAIAYRAPGSEAARVLRQCSEALRKLADETAPEWVPLSVVRDRTGWGDAWLHDRVDKLLAQGKAEKRGRVWWIERAAALAIPVKRDTPAIATAKSIEDLADRVLAMQTP